MEQLRTFIRSFRGKLSGRRASLVLVALSYLFFTVLYMGPSTWDCGDTLYGFGDNTAGPVWRFGLEPSQSPLGNYQNVTNYPVGENMFNPANYSLSGQSYVIWAASKALGPVCGYNVFNMVGFIASAGVMFGFIYVLTRKKSIAWLAGFAVSFSPYYQMKVGGHPGYGYQALLIGAAWAFYNLLKKRRKRDGAVFALLCASCFYFDPYFSLLATAVIAPIALVWLGLAWLRKRKVSKEIFKAQLRAVLISFAMFVAFMVPLFFVAAKYGSTISSSVAAYRGNVLFEARACSNLPHEYLTPFVLHPVFSRIFGTSYYKTTIDQLHNGFSCGIGEDTVGISIVIVAVTTLGLSIWAWELINRRRVAMKLGYDQQLIVFGMLAVLIFGVALALPPGKLLGIIPTPSYLLLDITTTWRTLTRMFVTVNFAFVTLFSLVLLFAWDGFRKYRKTLLVLFVGLFLGIFVEYMAFKPFTGNELSTFSYKRDTPTIYTWLQQQDDIGVVAEYPLERSGGESNAMAYYLSMQAVHKKKLFNGNVPTTASEDLKMSLKDVSDPQTIQVLGSVGVDAVVIHGVSEAAVRAIPGLEVIKTSQQEKFNILAFTPLVTYDQVVIARVKPSNTTQFLAFEDGFARNATIIKSAADWNYEALNKSILKVEAVPGKKIETISQTRCFDMKIAGSKDTATVTILADGKAVEKRKLTAKYESFRITASDTIVLTNDKGYNMQVRNLGCN